MKNYISFFILFFFVVKSPLFAQVEDSSYRDILILSDSLQTEDGIELVYFGSWKYKPGDDSTWANPNFDDADWQSFQHLQLFLIHCFRVSVG